MMGHTHLMGGVASLWLLRGIPDVFANSSGSVSDPLSNIGLLALAAAFGAVLPDLDAQESYLKRWSIKGVAPFAVPATVLHQSLGHRNLLHSLLGLGLASIVVALPLGLWLGLPAGLAVVSGYASHLLLDSCTKSGIPLLFPNRTSFHALPKPLWITTGSPAEGLAFAVLALLAFVLLLPSVFATGGVSL